jgi:homoserine dehydrogenase
MLTSASGLVRFYKSQSKSIDRLITKKIKVRLISHVTPQTLNIARELKNVLQVRTSTKLDSEVMIIDSQTIVVVEAMPDDLADESSGDLAVISENLQVISSFKNLFEITWATLPSTL